MLKFVFTLAFLFSPLSFAQVSQADRNCISSGESRLALGKEEVCVLDVSCERYQRAKSTDYYIVGFQSYCRTGLAGRCPKTPAECDKKRISDADILKLVPIARSKPPGKSGAPENAGAGHELRHQTPAKSGGSHQ